MKLFAIFSALLASFAIAHGDHDHDDPNNEENGDVVVLTDGKGLDNIALISDQEATYLTKKPLSLFDQEALFSLFQRPLDCSTRSLLYSALLVHYYIAHLLHPTYFDLFLFSQL